MSLMDHSTNALLEADADGHHLRVEDDQSNSIQAKRPCPGLSPKNLASTIFRGAIPLEDALRNAYIPHTLITPKLISSFDADDEDAVRDANSDMRVQLRETYLDWGIRGVLVAQLGESIFELPADVRILETIHIQLELVLMALVVKLYKRLKKNKAETPEEDKHSKGVRRGSRRDLFYWRKVLIEQASETEQSGEERHSSLITKDLGGETVREIADLLIPKIDRHAPDLKEPAYRLESLRRCAASLSLGAGMGDLLLFGEGNSPLSELVHSTTQVEATSKVRDTNKMVYLARYIINYIVKCFILDEAEGGVVNYLEALGASTSRV
ncbi:hypothetical protein PENSPDRAFT_749430 [Peniophora sp. CONT]|nr:hypothetical protein PENSPDRAFT_749430 [Peniophora sp. CONT]